MSQPKDPSACHEEIVEESIVTKMPGIVKINK